METKRQSFLEECTWDLINRLIEQVFTNFSYRTSKSQDSEINQPLPDYASDSFFIQHEMQSKQSLAELQIVKQWLEDCAQDTDLDAHGMSVKRRSLDEPVQEQKLQKYIFQQLRRGNLGQALDFCMEIGQPWRAAILSGSACYENGSTDDTDAELSGNPNRILYKYCCLQASKDQQKDIYERATFGILAGQLEPALSVSSSWEDELWVYVNAILEGQIDQLLQSRPAKFSTDSIQVPLVEKSVVSVFQSLSISQKEASRHPFRVIQSFFILDRLVELYQTFKASMHSTSSEIPDSVHFIVELIVQLRQVSYPKNNPSLVLELENDIIKQYVRMLSSSNQSHLVAIYAAKLPAQLQIQVFSEFLAQQTTDKHQKNRYLEQAEQQGLDVTQVAISTVQKILETSTIDYSEIQFPRVAMNSNEQVLVDSIDWLLFNNSMHASALEWSNRLIRQFLVNGKVNCASQILSKLPVSLVKPDWMESLKALVDEHLMLKYLVQCVDQYSIWCDHYAQKPANSQTRELNIYKNRIIKETADLEHSVKSWLSFIQFQEEIRDIRQIYAPQLVMWLMNALQTVSDLFQDGNFARSMQLVNDLARDPQILIDFKKSGLLPMFLNEIKTCFIGNIKYF